MSADILHFHEDDLKFWNQIRVGNCYSFVLNAPFAGMGDILDDEGKILWGFPFALGSGLHPGIKDPTDKQSFIQGLRADGAKFAGMKKPAPLFGHYVAVFAYSVGKILDDSDFHCAKLLTNENRSEFSLYRAAETEDTRDKYVHRIGPMDDVKVTDNPFIHMERPYDIVGYFYIPNRGLRVYKKSKSHSDRYIDALRLRGEKRRQTLDLIFSDFKQKYLSP